MLKPNREILIATGNPGKIIEITKALQSLPVSLRHLGEFPAVSTVDEVGKTYEANAVLKAIGYARQTGLSALADDSGLEVDALGGGPGVYSARFGGDNASDKQRVEKLLTALSEHRDLTARFVCCMALAGWQSDERKRNDNEPRLLKVTMGRCEGVIVRSPRGENGFGYDPVFVPTGYRLTFGELSSEIKENISHRALALMAMKQFLESGAGSMSDKL